ncbi:hypothetical protein D3C85_865100 [compost metagenome]
MSAASETTSSAAEASQVWLDTAAVIDGYSAPTVSRLAIFSRVVSRGVSSYQTPSSGTISRVKRPPAMALRARWWLSRAKASICARLSCQ